MPGYDPYPTDLPATHRVVDQRLQFVYSEIGRLNRQFHNYVLLFQGLCTSLIGGVVAVFVGSQGAAVPPAVAATAIRGLIGALWLFTLFQLVLIAAGLVNWFHYRHEEVKLLRETGAEYLRNPPSWTGLWRWQETWVAVFLALAVVLISLFVEVALIPALGGE